MAFPIPSHLPRRAAPQDVSSKILSKMDEATSKSLNASLAKSWLEELDATIQSTKDRVHDRIHEDLPEFERQLQTSVSVQTRLKTLTDNVDLLEHSLSDPETGLVPSLLRSLTAHSALAQEAINAKVRHEALSHLSLCRAEYSSFAGLVADGDLPEATVTCQRVEGLFQSAPAPLGQSSVLRDLKQKFSATKARAEEQLSEAYSRSVLVSSHELLIYPSVQVRQTERIISLTDILASLSSTSLSNHLTTLRRDITLHYIDALLMQPMSFTENSTAEEHKLACFPAPPINEVLSTRLGNLSRTLQFLCTHLFSCLPSPASNTFRRTLCKPVSSSVLNNLLIPCLPSSFEQLPSFLSLVKDAVAFEDECIVRFLGNDPSDTPIKAWADGVGGHYERQRRMNILDRARKAILEPDDFSSTFVVEVEVEEAQEPSVVPVQADNDMEDTSNDALWGFKSEAKGSADEVEDSWGFDDTEEPTEEAEIEPIASVEPPPETNGHDDPDPGDAWGWNDDDPVPDDEATGDDTAWDDPWGDDSTSSSTKQPETRPPPAPSITSPKVATRLEKLANKGKKHLNGNTPTHSPSIDSPMSPNSSLSPAFTTASAAPVSKSAEKRPPKLAMALPKETYIVSGSMKDILSIVQDVLHESQEFTSSHLTAPHESSASPGTTLFQTSASVLDLYRALYPVVFHAQLESLEGPIRFSNNCLYLNKEIEQLAKRDYGVGFTSVKDRYSECAHRLKILGDSLYYDAIETKRQLVDSTLTDGASGFTYTGDQDRYDECEGAMNRVLQEIRRLAQRWKGILTKSKYYTAIGSITDAALSRVLQDILALPDIPEVESHRLSELCRILHALEGLYVEDPEQPSFVVAYVPSWLKFSYLSELLEASLADITYLFEEGALVDFEVDELVRLVRALFADTVLRTNTINKLLGGHPTLS